MEGEARFVGIDVSKAQVDVAVRPTGNASASSMQSPPASAEDHQGQHLVRPRLHHLRDLRSGQGGRTPPRLYRQAGHSHPLLAIAAGTGDVLMDSRLREGRANTARGAAHFLRETVGRVPPLSAS